MPLLLTPPTPFLTTAAVPVASVYAIIAQVRYRTREKVIDFEVAYYAHEAAYLDEAMQVQCQALPPAFAQVATADEANAVPIFTFLEQVLIAKLTALLGEGTTIESVA